MKKKLVLLFTIATLLCALLVGTTTTAMAEEVNAIVIGQTYELTDDGKEYQVTILTDTQYEIKELNGTENVPSKTGEYICQAEKLTLFIDSEEFGTFNVSGNTLTPVISAEGIIPDDLTLEELKQLLIDELTKLIKTGEGGFFEEKVLPLIIVTVVDLVLVGLCLVIPYIKNRGKKNLIEGYAQGKQEENTTLSELLKSIDPKNIQQSMEDIVSKLSKESFEKYKTEIAELLKLFATMKTTMETTYKQLKALIDAARQAWASKPEAAALLAESPEKEVLDEKTLQNEKLKQYIRDSKGEEAEKIINDIGGN